MAYAAIRLLLNVIGLYELFALLHLLSRSFPIRPDGFGRFRLIHLKNIFFPSDEFCRVLMAFQAPFHVQRVLLIHERHFIDRPVAGDARHTLSDVDAMVEVDEIGEVMNAVPLHRLSRAIGVANGLKQCGVGPNLRVTGHTRFRGRNSRKCRLLDGTMTIPAVDPQASHVMLMAKRDGLITENSLVGEIGRTEIVVNHRADRSNDDDYT